MMFKKSRIQFSIENRSAFPIGIVWENAKDLEHVATLHQRTNNTFEMLYVGKESNEHEYDVLAYCNQRRLLFLPLNSFGFRKIIAPFNLYQIEKIPLLGLTIALNSLLKETGNPQLPTLLLDEVIVEGPWWMKFFKKLIYKSLKRHTAIQCKEDESFRARRLELQKRGIHLPYKIYSRSSLDKISALFKETLGPCEN